MKGSNTIEFNPPTMIEAVQMYLDSVLTEPHRVKVASVSRGDYEQRFTVNVESPESVPEALTP